MMNTPSDLDNDFDYTIGEGGEKSLILDFSIKGDVGILFFLTYNSNNEVKGVS